MLEHSEAKTRLLSLYMDRYLNIMSGNRYVSDISIYDLFCGQGIYKNGGKGSPIIFLEKRKNIHYINKTKKYSSAKFHCFFNDNDESKLDKLRKTIQDKNLQNPAIGNLKITQHDYRKALEKTIDNVNKLKKDKTFVFIDPYGYKKIRAEDIKRLLQTEKSEVLLFLPTQNMFRFEKEGTPKSLKRFISELVPKKEWPKSATGLDFIENLVNRFRDYLGETYFVDSFILARSLNQYFCLFFFTSHIRGFEKMLEAKWKIDEEEGRSWKYKMKSDLFAEQEKIPKTDKLKSELIHFLQGERTNADIYEFCLHQGYLPSPHGINILREFQSQDRLIKELANGNQASKNAFYINYKKYKQEPSKINMKLKN